MFFVEFQERFAEAFADDQLTFGREVMTVYVRQVIHIDPCGVQNGFTNRNLSTANDAHWCLVVHAREDPGHFVGRSERGLMPSGDVHVLTRLVLPIRVFIVTLPRRSNCEWPHNTQR